MPSFSYYRRSTLTRLQAALESVFVSHHKLAPLVALYAMLGAVISISDRFTKSLNFFAERRNLSIRCSLFRR